MIVQEEIPYTEEEYKAMVKTIDQLRSEKKELIDKACEWLVRGGYCVNNTETIDDFRKAMEE